MRQSRRHVECAESLPQATRVSTECRDISENMSRHAASPTSAHLTRHPMPKSPLHGHASHANSPLTHTRRTAPRWLEGLLSMPDRPVKNETGQNDSLRRENEKHEKGTTFAMRFLRSVAVSVLQIAAGPSLVIRNAEDLLWPLGTSWRSARDQAGEAGDRRFRTVFGEVRPDALRDPGALHQGSQQCSEAWTNVTAAENGFDSGTVACR